MGRKSSLTPETKERVLTLIRLGNYVETACAAVGIHTDTLYGWMRRAKGGEQPYAAFADAFAEASAIAETRLIEIIDNASVVQWQAAAWKAERRFPQRWRLKSHVELTGKDGGPIQTEVTPSSARKAIAELFGEHVVAPPSFDIDSDASPDGGGAQKGSTH